MSRVLSLAGFQVTIIGRFWVTAEGEHPEWGSHVTIGTLNKKLANKK
jgi:hypothetical protein